jgi:signal transduction histidine kinase
MEIDKEFADNFFLPRVLAASLISLVMLGGILLIRLRIRELQFVADLREREASLRKAMALQSRMISSVSHELRTPLSSILGYASIIANEDTDQDMQSFGRIIEGAADHLKRVIDGVLDLSKKEAGHVEYVEDQFDVRALVNRCVELFRGGADAKGIVLALRVDSDVGEFFETDSTKLTQIIENLLSNALKNTVAGSIELRVSSAQSGKALEFSVKDTGAGIGPEDMKNLFKMFHRIDDDFHRTLPGSGIGLNIVKEFSQLMGGDVAVDSTLGKGTAFRVTIPAARHRSEVA